MKFKYLLQATGGGPGGGWNSDLGFRQLSRGFSVWISDGERFTRHIKSIHALNWRTACQAMLAFEAGWIGCECSDLKNIYKQGISGWQSDLLVLSSVNQELLGFEEVVRALLQLDEEDLEITSRYVGTFCAEDTLSALRKVFSSYPCNPLRTWEMMGGVPEDFSLPALLERIEEAHERHVEELEEIAEPFEKQISCLIHTVLGERPVRGIADMRIYEDRRSSLRTQILEFLQKKKRLPTVLELTGK